MRNVLLKLSVIIVFGFTWTGCMVSGGLVIHPEPVVIGDAPQKGKYEKRRSKEHRKGHYKIPPGHMPPPGKCRIWYYDRPPGHQPPPVSCHRLGRRIPHGAVLVRG